MTSRGTRADAHLNILPTRKKEQRDHATREDGKSRFRSFGAEQQSRRFDADDEIVGLVLVGVNRVVEQRPKYAGAVERKDDRPIAQATKERKMVQFRVSQNREKKF